jgi:hypothetical protein
VAFGNATQVSQGCALATKPAKAAKATTLRETAKCLEVMLFLLELSFAKVLLQIVCDL